VYALGCVAYFLLTAKTPFVGDTLVEVCAQHLHTAPKPPSTLVSEVPPELDALVLRCLEKSPELRPTTHELATAFGA
jgi:serine/threonine-protein kinase